MITRTLVLQRRGQESHGRPPTPGARSRTTRLVRTLTVAVLVASGMLGVSPAAT